MSHKLANNVEAQHVRGGRKQAKLVHKQEPDGMRDSVCTARKTTHQGRYAQTKERGGKGGETDGVGRVKGWVRDVDA